MKSRTTRTSKNTSEIERVKLDLLSLVSHELRTPLTSVLNALRVLREEELSLPDRTRFLDMALRNAEKLNQTLGQLLDLSKLVSGRLVCRFHEVSLKHLLTLLLERFEAEAQATGGKTVQVTGSPDSLPVVMGDGPRLEKVLSSVFENALRFSPPGSKITLKIKSGVKVSGLPGLVKLKPGAKAESSREFVVLELENALAEGALVPGKEVFEVFSQQEDVLDRVHEGIGGSLAIAAEVLSQHDGAMAAESSGGKFTVWIVIPVLENERALVKVLESRMFALKTEVGAISLMILKIAPGGLRPVDEGLKSALFRASDTVYRLAATSEVAVLMDDCKQADAPKIVKRLLASLGTESAKFLEGARVGIASCPEDGSDPEKLLTRAREASIPVSEL